MNIIIVICENNARPVLKNVGDSAHARNHVICLRWPKCLNAVVRADVDLPYWTSKVEHIEAFTAIFRNIRTCACAETVIYELPLIIPTKFEVDMTIHCRVTAFMSADTSRDLVTLTFDLLTLSSCHTWRVT